MKEALKQDSDYVMISGSDDIFPRTYIEKIVEELEKNDRLVMASGYVVGEPWDTRNPRGGGRVIRTSFLRMVGLYPLNFGWETYPIFKALSLGLEAKAFPVPFHSSRPSSRNPIKYYYLGKGMKVLNYWSLHAWGRIMLVFFHHPLEGSWMLSGYLSESSTYMDLKGFVSGQQKRDFLRRIRRVMMNSL
jgi:hypothetical protein